MSDVFISYSRQESLFANRIADELEKNGRTVWIDRKGIELTTDWWDEISRGIEGADNFVLVMSPSSLSSPVCHLEIELALKLTKRIIPLYHIEHSKETTKTHFDDRLYKFDSDGYLLTLYGERNPMATFMANWEVLPSINRVDALIPVTHYEDKDGEQVPAKLDDDAFAKFLALLNRAIDTDMAHVRTHTRLLTHIRDWHKSEQKTGFLLTPEETDEAEAWLQAWEDDKKDRAKRNLAPKNPKPDDAIRNYIAISRKQVNTVKRQQRNLVIATVTFAVVGIISIIAVLGSLVTLNATENQASTARADATQAGFAQSTAQSDVATSIAIQATTAFERDEAAIQGGILALYADALLNINNDERPLKERLQLMVEYYPEEPFVYYTLSLNTQSAGDLEGALGYLDEAIRLDADYGDAYGNRAIVREYLGDLEGAFEDYAEAIRLAPEDPSHYFNRGVLKQDLEDYTGAESDYTEALGIDETYAVAYYNRGVIRYNNLADNDGALADWRKAESLGYPLPDDVLAIMAELEDE
jgi:Flp pilus assembly protein TadD